MTKAKKALKKRTWHYIQHPRDYEICCDKCKGHNIQWSEFERMIWCYDCKIDTRGDEGVFDGPIPMQCSELMGMRFDRYDMIKKEIQKPVVNEKTNVIDYIKMSDEEIKKYYGVTKDHELTIKPEITVLSKYVRKEEDHGVQRSSKKVKKSPEKEA